MVKREMFVVFKWASYVNENIEAFCIISFSIKLWTLL